MAKRVKKLAAGTKAPAQAATSTSTHDSGELVLISGSIVPHGMPVDEGGPRAWSKHFFEDKLLTATRVAQVALLQLAKQPSHRPVMYCRHRVVFVFSDRAFPEKCRQAAAGHECRAIGTLTEAQRLGRMIRWIELRSWFSKDDIIALAVNEIQLAREEDSSLEARDVLMLLWKDKPSSFGGVAMMEIGRAICDTAFTLGTKDVPAFVDRDDDDDLSRWKDE